MSDLNTYARIIEKVFFDNFERGSDEVSFDRSELSSAATALGVDVPKNLGDIIYSFRYRAELPHTVQQHAPPGKSWIIRPAGRSKYAFQPVAMAVIKPASGLVQTRIPDSTPGLIERYALTDEQALLAVIRYNRLVDIFTGITCYSLQSHLRTSVASIGQVEVDELYLGIDKFGVHYVLPIQAKGGNDILSVVQIEQDIAVCGARFKNLLARPIAVQFLDRKVVAMIELQDSPEGLAVAFERHFKLVPPDEISEEEMRSYRRSMQA